MYVLYRITGVNSELPDIELIAASEDRVKIEKMKYFFPLIYTTHFMI
jgi:hypothetical protein